MADQDFTKSRSYAFTDLFVKSISALAIVFLGVAGWRLQKADQSTRKGEDERRQLIESTAVKERRYLPMLRSITEVDFILVETSADYTWPNHSEAEVNAESRLGTHLSYFGGSLIFPDGEPSFGVVTATDNARATPHPKIVMIPARSAILMLAELMRLAPFFKRLDGPQVSVNVADGELVFTNHGAFLDSITLDHRTVPAWTSWLPSKGMSLHDLFYEVDLDTMADDLHDQLRSTAEGVVRKNADVLSVEYVKIRDDVLKSRNDLLPTRQP